MPQSHEQRRVDPPSLGNLEKLRRLFPGCVTEARDEETGQLRLAVDFDQLRQELSGHIVEGAQERYRLDWPGKREALALANEPTDKTLRPSEESKSFDTTRNLFIEGDNLEALKLIHKTYLGQIKLIYIDPPYNTGKDLIYKDNFRETLPKFLSRTGNIDKSYNKLVANTNANGRFHSSWLSFLLPRLKIAWNLLREDGCIAMSISWELTYNSAKPSLQATKAL